jgi:hypothetical protein
MSSLAITLNAAGVQVMPGQAASFTVEVRNLGSVVDRYRCEIVGMDPGWVTVTPASVELFPAREPDERARGDAPPTVGRFSVAVHPPRSAAATAGAWPIGAKVVSEHDPANRLVEEATITILPFGALDADLRPALMGGRFGATTVVHLTNAGNRPEAVTITGSDRAERIDFRIDKPILNLGPGETVNVRLRLSGGDVKLVGGHDTRPFSLDVRAAAYDTPPVSLSGTYERKALIPTGLPVAVATILALGMGGLAIKQAFFNGDPAANVANTTTIGASPSAAAGQSAAPAPPSQAPATPPPSAPPTPPPSAPPTPTPTPTAPPTAPPTPTPTPYRPYGPDQCIQGFVWREAWPEDHVCVTPDQRQRVAEDNAQAPYRVDPTGPYGPNTCVQGYVWREARAGDVVCVTPDERTQVAYDNSQAQSRIAP